MGNRVLIVGGGLAGLSAAAALAPRGFRVTLLESRNRLGGRASSFTDTPSGQLVDNCQHVSMGCCTNFAHFCRTVGIAHHLHPQPCLYFMTPDRRLSLFRAADLPAPLHLFPSFLRLHHLSPTEKVRIAWGLVCLQRTEPKGDPPFLDWLTKHGQTAHTIECFWSLVLTSALNETPDRIGMVYARKVFLDGFLRHPRGFEVQLPVVPLSQLYGEELHRWLDRHGVRIVFNAAVKNLHMDEGRVAALRLRNGADIAADWYIAAVPFDRLLNLLPAEVVDGHGYFRNLQMLETSPITSVHLWLDRPITSLPHVVLVDCLGQWVFPRGQTALGEHYLQVVISAARPYRALGSEEVQRRVIEELRRLFPPARNARLLRARTVTEHAATFSAVPGVDQWRPVQASPISNLFLAGDWTATGWPATMESAVRSGYLAAESLLERANQPHRCLQPDLAKSGMGREPAAPARA